MCVPSGLQVCVGHGRGRLAQKSRVLSPGSPGQEALSQGVALLTVRVLGAAVRVTGIVASGWRIAAGEADGLPLAVTDLREQADDDVIPGRGQRMKRAGAGRVGRNYTIGEQGVGVAVEVEQRAEPLDERDGAGLWRGDAMSFRRTPPGHAASG